MSYIVFRDGPLLDKLIAGLVITIFLLFFLTKWFPGATIALGPLFTITFLLAGIRTFLYRFTILKSSIKPVFEVATEQMTDLKSKNIPMTPENMTSAVQEAMAKKYGVEAPKK